MRFKLTSTLLGAMSGIVLLAMAAGYGSVRQEIDEMFDYELRAVALSIDAAAAPGGIGRVPDDEVLVQVWSPQRELLYRSDARQAAPYPAAAGYATLRGGAAVFRSYSRAAGGRTVQVAQTLATRRGLAFWLSLRLLAPLLLALPLLALAVWWLVRRSLRPVQRLGTVLAARTDDMLETVPGRGLPDELQPLLEGFNRLLQRLAQSFAAQRSLVADAAHQLRTPLAVVQLQAQALQRKAEPQEQEAALLALRGGVERAARLVQQLLTLARQEPAAGGAPLQPLRFDLLVREVLAELVPLAHDKNLDLTLHADQPVTVAGDRSGLQALVGNLVDNAVNYTPESGQVEVSLELRGSEARLVISDTGPGIARGERELVLQRFYRAPGTMGSGSGLGLAIAAVVVQRHGGKLSLDEAEGGGLRVEVSLPASAAQSTA